MRKTQMKRDASVYAANCRAMAKPCRWTGCLAGAQQSWENGEVGRLSPLQEPGVACEGRQIARHRSHGRWRRRSCSACQVRRSKDQIPDGLEIAHITRTAADVASQCSCHRFLNLLARNRLTRQLLHQHGRGIDEPGGTIAALEAEMIEKDLLHRRRCDLPFRVALGYAFDGANALAIKEVRVGDAARHLHARVIVLVPDHHASMAD